MIASSVVSEIKRLLAGGSRSQREIARMTGVSRGTVGAIATGKRTDYDALSSDAAEEIEEPTGPPRRCPGCGGMVYIPCRLCHVRKLVAESRVARPPGRPDGLLQLELAGDQLTRYQRIRPRHVQEEPRRRGS